MFIPQRLLIVARFKVVKIGQVYDRVKEKKAA